MYEILSVSPPPNQNPGAAPEHTLYSCTSTYNLVNVIYSKCKSRLNNVGRKVNYTKVKGS